MASLTRQPEDNRARVCGYMHVRVCVPLCRTRACCSPSDTDFASRSPVPLYLETTDVNK